MASVATSLQRFQLDAYFNAGALSLLAYDFTLTFDDEVELIWKTRWNLTKVLWFLTRYPAFIDSTLSIYHQVGTNVAIRTCGMLYSISGWMFLWGIWIAEIILIIRTWAIWGRNHYIGGTLFTLLCGLWIVSAVYLNQFLHSFTFVLAKNISPILTGCVITSSGDQLWISFVILMIFESIILTLTAIKGIQQFRRSSSPLVTSLYRDGMIFYVYLFGISVINVSVLLAAPAEYSILITS
ncbi:hypothetical protein PHLGIDRAFT_423189 [Phlebiopsis gigantea 11061_1 CR5-6]|uniref:DUF6533 domain-containing protein n=1 Tax=Phlebiopsis gigantea (strain 11061_1 CR5-6) TaxID=745531 RepID=A0A0C3NQH1_PHLG1|nr:hypothetical protein PHLGIDRAFT_423189 [Phlebiopsis gigantea 11061_1 CR5-6]